MENRGIQHPQRRADPLTLVVAGVAVSLGSLRIVGDAEELVASAEQSAVGLVVEGP